MEQMKRHDTLVAPLFLSLLAAGCGGGNSTAVDGSAGPTCAAYCTAVMANCMGAIAPDGGAPTYQQFTTMANCLNSCKAYPVGATGDQSGDTLGCRQNHAVAAKTDPTQCDAAGPGGAGVCGTDCQGYCQIAQMYCTAANSAMTYSSLSQCMSVCGATPNDVAFSINVQAGPHVACLLYHVQEGSSDPPDHCLGDLLPTDAGPPLHPSVTCM
jgi:hypothetical protein